MYEVIVSPQALEGIKHLKKILRSAVNEAIKDLKEDPLYGKPLTRKLTGMYTYKLGVYRIIYIINKKDKKVNIVTAGHHSTVYN